MQSQTFAHNVSGVLPLNVFPVRPALVAISPENVAQNLAERDDGLIGGYFSGATICDCKWLDSLRRCSTAAGN